MELGALVSLGLSKGIRGLAGAELTEVFGRLGHYIVEELKSDAPEGFTYGKRQ